jgi:hypothetical protein
MANDNNSIMPYTIRELTVPAIMVAFAAAYWSDAWALSIRAKAFPLGLTTVLTLAIAWVVYGAVRKGAGSDAIAVPRAGMAARIVIVLAPAALVAVWDYLGATLALAIYAMALLVLLKERRPLLIVLLPAGLALALVFVFRTFLYMRLPTGLAGLG